MSLSSKSEPSDSEEEEDDLGTVGTPRSSITPSVQSEFSDSDEDEDEDEPDSEDEKMESDEEEEEEEDEEDEDEEEEKEVEERKKPANVDFGLDVGLNVVKRSVGSSMMQNAQNMAALKQRVSEPEPSPNDDDSDDGSDDGDDDDGTLASALTDDDDRLPPPPAALVASVAAAPQQHTVYTGAGLSKVETAKRISIMQPVALASGYSRITVKFSGYADDFEDAFLRVSGEELEILVATGDAAKFDLTQAAGRCTIEADASDPTIFYLHHYEYKIIVCSGTVEYRREIFAAVPQEIIVIREVNALTQAGQSEDAMIVTKDGRLKALKSVEDLLQGTDSDDEGGHAANLAAAQRLVDAAKQVVAPRASVSFSPKRPSMPPPATAPEILSPPRGGPPSTALAADGKSKAKKTVFLRSKVPSLRRTKLLCHWLNSLRLRATAIEPVTLDTDFCTGTLLCDLMQRLDPSVQYGEGTIIARPLSKKAALNNLELGISAIFHSNKDVRRTRIAQSIHIYEGDVPRIGAMLDEIFVAFAHKPLFAALPAMLDWYNEVLSAYGLALPRDRIVKARKGGEGLWELRTAFQSGLALFCIVHYFHGPKRVGDRTLLVDPSRIYREADTVDKCRLNVSYVLSLLAALGVDVLWEVEDWVACADLEFVVLQLQLVWAKFRDAPCALPDLIGEPETLLLTTVSVSTAVATDKEGRRSVLGMIYADSLLSQSHPSASSSSSTSSSSATATTAAASSSSSSSAPSSPRLPLSPHSSLKLTSALVDSDKVKSPPAWNKATIEDNYSVTDNPNEYAQIARLHQAAGLHRSEGSRHYETSKFRDGHKGGQPPEEAPRLQLAERPAAPDLEAQLAVLAETRRRMEQDQAVILREIERLEDDLAEGYVQLEEQSELYDAEGYEERLEVLEAERARLERERDKCLDVFALRYDALRLQEEALGSETFSPSASFSGGSSSPASPRLTSPPAKKPNPKMSATFPSPSKAQSPSRRASTSPPAAQVMVTSTKQSNLILKKVAASSEAYVATAYTPPNRRKSMVAELFEKNQRAAELASPVFAPPLEAFTAFKLRLKRESLRWRRTQQVKGAGSSRRDESVYKIKIRAAATPNPRRVPLPPTKEESQWRLQTVESSAPAVAEEATGSSAGPGDASVGSVLQAIRAEELGRMSYEDSRRVLLLQLARSATPEPVLREVSDENENKSEAPLRLADDFSLMQGVDDALEEPIEVEAIGLPEPKAAPAPRPLLRPSKKPMRGIDSDDDAEVVVGNWIDDDEDHHHHPPPPPPPLSVTPPATLRADRNLNTPSTPPATRPVDRTLNTPSTPPASVPADCSLHPPTPAAEAPSASSSASASAPTPAPSIVVRVSEQYMESQDNSGSPLVGAIKAWRRLSLNELDGDDEAAAAAARGPYPAAEEVPARTSEKSASPPSKATTMTARRRTLQNASRKERLKWLSVPRSVTVEDTKKTASLYPKNATMALRTQLDEADPQNQDKATHSLAWWESAGLQLVSPSKPPSFQVLMRDVVEIRQGELRDASKLTLLLAASADFKVSGGRKLIVFKCMSIDDATEYRELLSSLIVTT